MFIDTHCHLVDEFVNPDNIHGLVARATEAGVGVLVAACAEPDDPAKTIALCDQFDGIYTTVGIHPEHSETVPNYEHLLSHDKVIGVGEIGLDYYYGADHRLKQIELFIRQLDIAKRAKLPVAIHTRNAEDDTADILTRSEFDTVGGVMHCYTSSWDLAKKMLDRGFYISASGIITFKNSDNVRDVFARVPLDRIVIETDAPFCAPVPYRGKPCEPFMVTRVADTIAEIKNVEISKLESILKENTKRLYPKIKI